MASDSTIAMDRRRHCADSRITSSRLIRQPTALNSAEVLLTRVALLSELVRAGIEPAEALEAPVAQRAATLYLAQTQDLAKPGTASLEVWSIDLGVSLSRIPALPTHQASAIASVTCHLADIHSNGAALRHLLITSATPVWASPVRAQVIAAAWEHRDALAPDDLALLQRVVETLRHDHALDDPPLEEETLTDLRDGVANYAEMLAGGHYEAAETVSRTVPEWAWHRLGDGPQSPIAAEVAPRTSRRPQ